MAAKGSGLQMATIRNIVLRRHTPESNRKHNRTDAEDVVQDASLRGFEAHVEAQVPRLCEEVACEPQ
jgi:hypothetical protein